MSRDQSFEGALDRLEQAVAPRGGILLFFRNEMSPLDPGIPPYAEQLAAFKTKNGGGPHDTIIEAVFRDQAT